MKITLELVRNTLRNGLGSDSFIASFISSVEESEDCSTACISAHGRLRYNPNFVANHISTSQDLFCLILHECMHPMFGHFIYDGGRLENLAADCVINASISMLFAGPSGDGSLFRKFYEPEGLEGLLRPESKMGFSRYARLYDVFYGGAGRDRWLTTGEVIQTLKALTPPNDAKEVQLLGAHGAGTGGQNRIVNESSELPADTLSRIADELRRNARLCGGMPGYGQNLMDLFVTILKTHMTLKRTLLEKWTTKRKLDGFCQNVAKPRIHVSPIPLRPSKRDLVLLSAGVTPLQYHVTATSCEVRKEGLAVYLDVSGSVNEYLPKILGLLQGLRDELSTVFLFSTQVFEVSTKVLLGGAVRTTYGTDFNCIAQSILDRGFEKAIVITDGYADLKADKQRELIDRKVGVLTVLFGGKRDCPEFAPLGDVVRLDDVTN